MLHDGFTRAERAGNRGGAAGGDREERVDDALTGDHWEVGRQLFLIGAAAAHRPFLQHRHRDGLAVLGFDFADGIVQRGRFVGDGFHRAAKPCGHHDFLPDDGGFLHRAQHVAGDDLLAGLRHGLKGPRPGVIQRGYLDAAGDAVARLFIDDLQRTLDAVEDGLDQPRPEFYAQRRAGGKDRFARAQAAGFFVNLDRSLVAAQFDDFTDQPLFRYAHHVVHLGVGHIFRDNQGACNLDDVALLHRYFTPLSFHRLTAIQTRYPRRWPSRRWP